MLSRRSLALLFIFIGLIGFSAGCSFPGWVRPEQTVGVEEPQSQLDLSGILIGSWEEWSEPKGRMGYLYAFYDDGLVVVSNGELGVIVLNGQFEFLGQDSFVVRWKLMGSGLQFQEMIWKVVSLKFNEIVFDLGNESRLTLRQGMEEQPFIPPSEGVNQTDSVQFQ